MSIARNSTLTGMGSAPGWTDTGYDTGDTDYPHARVRVVALPQLAMTGVTTPNGAVAATTVAVQIRAAICGLDGTVLQIGNALVMSDPNNHCWQADSGVTFNLTNWLDGLAAAAIDQAVGAARSLTVIAAAGLLPVTSATESAAAPGLAVAASQGGPA